ncbi:MAG: acetylxylan esterase [Singulisphaera sp.]
MTRPLVLRSFFGFLIASTAAATGAEDNREKFLKAELGREIIGPRQTLADTAEYVESRVPRMPEVKTLAEWEKVAGRMRADALERVIYRGEAAAWRDAKCGVEWLETVEGGPGKRIKKQRYEAMPGLRIPALLYEPETMAGKVPVVLNVNGHDRNGKAAGYKQIRCINLAKRGMLALSPEWFGMGQLATDSYRHDQINHIDLCGAGGIATHYLALTRGLDVLLGLEHADPERVAVTGLSGGGWQTIFLSAFDTRVTLTDPVAGYSSFLTRVRHFTDLGDSEQTPSDLATVTDYAPMTAMMAPRPTLLTYNAKDNCCFAADHALPPLLDAARPIFKLYEKEANLRTHINHDPGTHNYELDNRQALYRMLGDHFFMGQAGYDPKEIPSESEVKTREQLDVTLPAGNATLHSLALGLSKGLPRSPVLPKEKGAAEAWRVERRARLREVVRARRFEVQAVETAAEEKEGVKATSWRLKVGEWSVPVVELVAGSPKATVLLVADSGRKEASGQAQELLARGNRVFVVDPFTLGESKIAEKEYLFALLLATVGDRPLGLQASQLAAVARWARAERKAGPVTIVAAGRRASVMAIVAAALEETAIAGLESREALGSLKEVIETKLEFPKAPELFCFGLLRDFDILQLTAMVAPRPVVFLKTSDRAKAELAELKAWYATLGQQFEPLR